MAETPRSDSSCSARDWLASCVLERLVARVAYRYGSAVTPEDLKDLVQETRIAIWETGPDRKMTTALVTRIAHNKAIDLIRGVDRRCARERVAARTAQTHDEAGELQHLLNARVASLPARLRQFYNLRYEQGFSEREIARSLGLCRASVRWLDRRCRLRVVGDLRSAGVPIAGESSRSRGHGSG